MELDAYRQLKISLRSLLGVNLDHYKDQQVRRRLDSWLARSGAVSWADYLRRVRSEPAEQLRFRNYLTINVSSFFRDAERWKYLAENVLPTLLQTSSSLKVWSAGCSIGPEPYSLAMLLGEQAPLRTHKILATDLDRGALAKAKARGPYNAQEVAAVASRFIGKYFESAAAPFFIKEKLAARVQFKEINLVDEEYERGFDLILCRNVVIYFTPEAKDVVFRKLIGALRPGGVLFIGGTEMVPLTQKSLVELITFSFYRKL